MSSLRFPDWWKGGFPDRELVVMDALTPVMSLVGVYDDDGTQVFDNGLARCPFACTWLPADYSDRLPVVRIYRGGGAADVGALRDPASVQVAVIGATRAASWELLEYCRQWLLSYKDGGTVYRADGSTTLLDTVEELVGPQQIPELNPDNRMVPMTFRVICRRPRGLPNYQKIRESLARSLAS